mgnify:CR=1 FL=1
MVEYDFWKRWKKKALKAKTEGLTAKCIACDDLIFPGDKEIFKFIGLREPLILRALETGKAQSRTY